MLSCQNVYFNIIISVVPLTAEEKELEESVFGNVAISSSSSRIDTDSVKVKFLCNDSNSDILPLLSTQFTIDKKPTKVPTTVWHDEDDDEIEINLNDTDRLKKLKKNNENIVSGTVFGDALKERLLIYGSQHYSSVKCNIIIDLLLGKKVGPMCQLLTQISIMVNRINFVTICIV